MSEVKHTGDPLEALELVEGGRGNDPISRVRLAPSRGGMVTRFTVGDVSVLFLDEGTLRDRTKSVRGGIPILFPIAGKLPGDTYTLAGQTYSMKQHGFARDLPWTILNESPTGAAVARVTLALAADDATRAMYPFEFALRFTYALEASTLTVTQRFENHGDAPMPIQPGVHPYFYVPVSAKASAQVETDATRMFDNVKKEECPLVGPLNFGAGEVDAHLLDPRRRDTILHRAKDDSWLPAVRLEYGDDQEVLVVWTLPGRDFICVEPWRAKFGALARGTAPTVAPGGAVETVLKIGLVG